MKQCGYAVNDAWCIDCLSLEFFHHIKETVVNVWLVRELNLDLIKITQRISNIQRPFRNDLLCLLGYRQRLRCNRP